MGEEKQCELFGNRPNVPKLKCTKCEKEKMRDCTVHRTIKRYGKKDQPIDKEEYISRYLSQIEKAKQDDSCFGAFAFEEEECWKGCDFNLECMIESGINPSENCTYFPPDEKEHKKDSCMKCVFFTYCSGIYKEINTKLEKEESEKELFKNFWTLQEFRNKTLIKEDYQDE